MNLSEWLATFSVRSDYTECILWFSHDACRKETCLESPTMSIADLIQAAVDHRCPA